MKGMIENIGRKALVIGLALVVGGQLAFSQGTVNMTNFSQGRVDAPVSGPSGERLSGARYKVQLLAGPTAELLRPVGDPISFERGAIAGYFFGPVLEIETVNPGATTYAALRAWDTQRGGTTFDRSSVKGVSNVIEIQTGGAIPGRPPALPGSLIGLKPFMISNSAPPSIERQPESVAVSVGADVELSFEVSGSVPMEISWTRDGVELPGATRNILRLSGVGPEDEGVYVATAKNAFGADTSEGAIVLANQEGGTVIFSNFFSGIYAPVLDVDGATKLSGDAFRAQLFAGPNARALSPVGPAVPFQSGALAGIWRQDPTSTRVIPTVRAGGEAVVQVRVWETSMGSTFEEASLNGSKVGVSETLSIVTGGAGAPPSLPASMTGLESFRLSEDIAPRIVEDLVGSVVDLGSPLSLSVGVLASEPMSYAWEKDGALLKGFGGPTLNIPEAKPSDAGLYSVSASNAQGSAQSSLALVFVRESGGQVVFSNLGFGVDAPVLDSDGTPLAGDEFRVAMFAGPTETLLMPVGPGIPFRTGPLAGYWSNAPTDVRNIPTVSAGGVAFVQARAWAAADGATYAEALAADGRVGQSNVVRVQTGGAGSPPTLPATLEGLESFRLGIQLAPTIVSGPESIQIVDGGRGVLSVNASGSGALTYQWWKNAEPIPGASQSELVIDPAESSDSGRYFVVVNSRLGKVTSSTAIVSVIGDGGTVQFANLAGDLMAPVYDVDGRTALAGDAYLAQLFAGSELTALQAVGPAVPFGTGGLSGFWSQEPSSARSIPGSQPGEKAWVQARVWEASKGQTYDEAVEAGSRVGHSNILAVITGGAGSPPSLPPIMEGLESFRLTDELPPFFVTHPESQLADAGSGVVLEALAQGRPSVNYQWYFNGEAISGQTANTLTLTNVNSENEGSYWVEASNASGAALSDVAVVQLNGSGGQVNFCNLTGGIHAPVFDIDGTTPLAGRGFLVQMFAGETSESLRAVGPAVPFSEGVLGGIWSKEPTAIRSIEFISVGAEASVQARVWETAKGPTFAAALAAGSNVGFSKILRVPLGGIPPEGVPSLPGNLDGLESFQLSDATLPIINEHPQGGLRLSGMSMEWTVGATSVSELSYQWQIAKGNGRFRDIPDETSSALSLTNLTPGDSGRYRVLVSNRAGTTTSAEAELSVVPPQPLLGGLNRNGDFALSLGAVVEDLGDSFEETIVEVQATTPEFDEWETIGEFPIDAKGKVEFIDKDASKHSSRIYRFLLKR